MYQVQKEKLNQALESLREQNIDIWLILTSEGSDPCIPLVTGVGTVGPGVFIVTKEGEKFALCSSIDAQDIEESELFDEVYKHSGSLAVLLAEVVGKINPNKIALNISKDATQHPDAVIDVVVMSPSGLKRSIMPHVFSNTRRIAAGDVIIHSRQVGLNGYRAELERTVIVGKPNLEQKRAFQAAIDAQQRAIDFIKPGVKLSEVDGAARRIISE